jgi:hypothetical protein
LYQQNKTGDTDGGARDGNYTINDAFCKKKIMIKETISAPIAFTISLEKIFGLLFLFMGAADSEQVDKSGQDTVYDENNGKVGIGFQPFIQKITDGEPDQNGTGKHQANRGISGPFFFIRQRRHCFQYSRHGGKDFTPFSPAALQSPPQGGDK